MAFPFDFGGGLLLVVLINLAFWGVLIVLAVVGIRWLIRTSQADRGPVVPPEDTALALLRERFARGEIDAAEFEERKRTLGG